MGANISYYDGQGNTIENGLVTFSGDGVDVEIVITALDGTELSYYVAIFVDEGASNTFLSGFELSVGALYPTFEKEIQEYTVVVPKGTTSIEITGIPNYPQATVSGGGTIPLSGGTGTTTLNVTSADKTASMTYTLNIQEIGVDNFAIQLSGENGNESNIDISGLDLNSLPYTIEMWFKPEGTQNFNSGLFYNRGETDHGGLQYASSWQTAGTVRFMSVFTNE